MRRLYFLLPNVECARSVVNELLHVHVEERHMHIIAKEGIPLEELPEAGLMERSDFVPALERGLALGGVTGLLGGLVAVTFPLSGLVAAGGALLFGTLYGATLGAMMSTMIGVDVPNTRLQRFHDAIAKGELMMMVDVPRDRVDEIEELIKKHHPEADIEGTEPTIPAFP